ncbi:MAG: hypothetical protein ACI8Z5_001682 [Lentimonas sp.]|jgi:hypothetical protein
MEMLKEALMSRNIIAWVIVLVVFVLCLKFLKSAGKGIVIFIGIVILCAILGKYFPGVVAPLVDLVKGGWSGENRP